MNEWSQRLGELCLWMHVYIAEPAGSCQSAQQISRQTCGLETGFVAVAVLQIGERKRIVPSVVQKKKSLRTGIAIFAAQLCSWRTFARNAMHPSMWRRRLPCDWATGSAFALVATHPIMHGVPLARGAKDLAPPQLVTVLYLTPAMRSH